MSPLTIIARRGAAGRSKNPDAPMQQRLSVPTLLFQAAGRLTWASLLVVAQHNTSDVGDEHANSGWPTVHPDIQPALAVERNDHRI